MNMQTDRQTKTMHAWEEISSACQKEEEEEEEEEAKSASICAPYSICTYD